MSPEIHHKEAEKALQLLKDGMFGSQLLNSGTETYNLFRLTSNINFYINSQ